jgi:hypothetical protein
MAILTKGQIKALVIAAVIGVVLFFFGEAIFATLGVLALLTAVGSFSAIFLVYRVIAATVAYILGQGLKIKKGWNMISALGAFFFPIGLIITALVVIFKAKWR